MTLIRRKDNQKGDKSQADSDQIFELVYNGWRVIGSCRTVQVRDQGTSEID